MTEMAPTPLYVILSARLRDEILSPVSVSSSELGQTLRSLQRLGLTAADIELLVERFRTEARLGQAGQNSTSHDEAAMAALDLIHGVTRGMSWSSATTAADALYRALELEEIVDAIPSALAPGDLVPPRLPIQVPRRKALEIAERLTSMLENDIYMPSEAYFARVPKSAFTSRPAALMVYPDRVFLETLSRRIASKLDMTLPPGVLWPRGTSPDVGQHQEIEQWMIYSDHEYFAKCDIESFYENIDHAILAKIAQEFLGLSNDYCLALEALLDTVMESTRGLPQGPSSSDPLASMYLAPLDLELQRRGWDFRRLQDDFWIGASTYDRARDCLQTMEELLREFGLRLNSKKTGVMKQITAVATLGDLVAYNAEADSTPPGASAILSASSVVQQLGAGGSGGGQDRLDGPTEVDVRKALGTLTRAPDIGVDASTMRYIIQWYPRLAPQIARYIAARPNPDDFRDFVDSEIEDHPSQAWVNSWLISIPLLAPRPPAALLEVAAQHSGPGHPLLQSSALRVLLNAGIMRPEDLIAGNPGLPESLWREFMAEAELGEDVPRPPLSS